MRPHEARRCSQTASRGAVLHFRRLFGARRSEGARRQDIRRGVIGTPVARPRKKAPNGGATLGFEEQMWQMAIEMRGHRDVAEWKHVVLGLIFLKYVNDSFQRLHAKLKAAKDDPEEPLEYQAENVFWLPKTSRWTHITSNSKNA